MRANISDAIVQNREERAGEREGGLEPFPTAGKFGPGVSLVAARNETTTLIGRSAGA